MPLRPARPLLLLAVTSVAAAHAAGWPELGAPAAAQMPSPDDAALVVGIERYVFLPPIRGAAANADDWHAWLTRARRLPAERVRLLRNEQATREQILAEAQEVAKLARPSGTLWLVFVGHGAPAPDGKDGLLVGVDAQGTAVSLAARSVRQGEVLAALGQRPSARRIAIVDACFSGKAAAGELAPGLQPVLPVALSRPEALVLSAGAADQFAGPLPGAGRPAFSYLVLGALRGWGDRDRDGKVSADEAVGYAASALQALVRDRAQTPQLTGAGGAEPLAQGAVEPGPDLAALARSAPEVSFSAARLEISVPRVELSALRSTSLRDIALEAEQLLDDATVLERKSPPAPAHLRAAAWCRLAALKEKNPYLQKATEACDQWWSHVRQRTETSLSLLADHQTLVGYLGLRSKTKEQKGAVLAAFLDAYGAAEGLPLAMELVKAARGGSLKLASASQELKRRCAGGDAESCTVLGEAHRTGRGAPKDLAAAASAYAKACAAGHAAGCHELAWRQRNAEGLKRDWIGARASWERACAAGHPEGCVELAHRLWWAEGGAQDRPRARALLDGHCDRNVASACRALGWLGWGGSGMASNSALAVGRFKKACDAGDLSGCEGLSWAKFEGRGIARDVQGALTDARRICDTGGPEAMGGCLRVAVHLHWGFGVEADPPKAAEYARSACEGGHPWSCSYLGRMYQAGDGVPQDFSRAFELFERACDSGDAGGCYYAGNQLSYGIGVPKDLARAAALFERHGKHSELGAYGHLAFRMRAGHGVPKDEARSYQLMKAACDEGFAGDSWGCDMAATARRLGIGISVDESVAEALSRRGTQLRRAACEDGMWWLCAGFGWDLWHKEPRDRKKALEYFTASCDRGYVDGCASLGWARRSGAVDPGDRATIRAAFSTGCARGDGGACDGLAQELLEHEPRDPAAAMAAEERGCTFGYPWSCYWVAHHAEVGTAGVADPDRAARYWARTRELFDFLSEEHQPHGLLGSGLIRKDGRGMPADPAAALPFLERGCTGGDSGACWHAADLVGSGKLGTADAAKSKRLFARACQLGNDEACKRAK